MPKKARGQTTPARKSFWGHLTARRFPLRGRHVIKVLHADTFLRDLSADEIPGNHSEPVLCSMDSKNESLAVVEVMVTVGMSKAAAARILRGIADAIDNSEDPFLSWQGAYSVRNKKLVGRTRPWE
jgi:hypothetical protein